jgi:hypothetical protein
LDTEGADNDIPGEPVGLISASLKCVRIHQVHGNATIISHSERKRRLQGNYHPITEERLISRLYELEMKPTFLRIFVVCSSFRSIRSPSNFSCNLPVVSDLLGKRKWAGVDSNH